jgi:hypothetical protein
MNCIVVTCQPGAVSGAGVVTRGESRMGRIGADHLGHSKVSMTQDRCMTRGLESFDFAAVMG